MEEPNGNVAAPGVRENPRCWCGRRKFAKHALCSICWRKLTEAQRASLFASDFALAYAIVVGHLRRRTRRRVAA